MAAAPDSSAQRLAQTLAAQAQTRLSSQRRKAVPLGVAIGQSGELSRLSEVAALSQRCWKVACTRMPQSLTQAAAPAGIKEGQWTWLARNSATAAKLKMLAPDVLSDLRAQGILLEGIRIKVSLG
jgi:hypothetical protein